jgi:DNA-binding XRE family transcriptional regulator
MAKGISRASLARTLGVDEMTIVNWEIRGMVPRIKDVRERLAREVEGAGRFL